MRRLLVQCVSSMTAFNVSFYNIFLFPNAASLVIAPFVIQVHFLPKLNILPINYTRMEFECRVLEVSTVHLMSNTLRTLSNTKPV